MCASNSQSDKTVDLLTSPFVCCVCVECAANRANSESPCEPSDMAATNDCTASNAPPVTSSASVSSVAPQSTRANEEHRNSTSSCRGDLSSAFSAYCGQSIGASIKCQSHQVPTQYYQSQALHFESNMIGCTMTSGGNGNAALSSPTGAPRRTPLHLSIMFDMSRLWRGEAIPADFSIRTGSVTHRAHRFVLMFRSRYFESMFRSGCFAECTTNEMTIDDVEPDVMDAVLKYLYLGIFSCQNMDQLIDLLIAADRFLLEELVSALTDAILRNLKTNNVLQVYQIADLYDFRAIARKAKQFINENGVQMLHESSFLELSEKELAHFLSQDRFCSIEDEVAIFVLRYLKRHKLEHNEKKVNELLGLVRFPMIVDMDALLPTLLAKANSTVFQAMMGKFHDADHRFRASAEGLRSLPYRHCYHATQLKLNYRDPVRLEETVLDNGNSIIATMAPCTIVLSLSRKSAFDRINLYVRCINSIHFWFEASGGETSDVESTLALPGDGHTIVDDEHNGLTDKYYHYSRGAVVHYDSTVDNRNSKACRSDGTHSAPQWHRVEGSNTWGHNRSFQIELPQVIYAKRIRLQLQPVATDAGSFPISISNLCFSLLYPYNDVLPVGDL